MNGFGAYVSGDAVRFERLLPAPPEQVWAYLTESELLSEWLGNGEIAREVGGKVELRSGGPVIRGTVLECATPRLLSYTWNVYMPGGEAPAAAESVLRFELTARGNETALALTHGPIAAVYRSRTAAGWHALLDILAARLSDEMPPDFVETFHRVHPDYEKLPS